MATQAFQKMWLKVAAVVIGCGGPILTLGTMPQTAEPARMLLDLLSFPVDGSVRWDSPDTRFLAALSGGFLMGWGVLVWCLSGAAHDAAPEAVRRAVVVSTLVWFVFDSGGSVLSGNAVNAALNVGLLLLILVPLWRPARG
jgi:hypothetical protein